METSTLPLRVTRLQETNFKRIGSADISPGARTLVILQGPNEAGKTSAVDGLIAAIGGKKRAPELPIRAGQESAIVEVELSDDLAARYRIVRSWKGDQTYLSVYAVNDDGTRSKLAAGQTLLDSLVSDVSFDPLAFARLNPQLAKDRLTQARLLCGAIGQPALIDQAEGQKATLAEQRKVLNQKAAQLKARLASELVDPTPGQDLHIVTPAGVQARLEAARAINEQHAEVARRVEKHAEECKRADQQLNTIEERMTELLKQKAQWADFRAKNVELAKQAAQEAAELPPMKSTAELTTQLDQINADNRRAEQQQAARAATKQLAEIERQAGGLTLAMEDVDAQTEKAIAASDLGKAIPGLTFKDGQLWHNGVPFSQASGMRRLELSALIGMAANPRLRIMTIDEGDQLDDASLSRLKELAASRGFQLWMTAIRAGDETDPDTCIVPIRNGQTPGANGNGNGQAAAGGARSGSLSPQAGQAVIADQAAPVAVASDDFDL